MGKMGNKLWRCLETFIEINGNPTVKLSLSPRTEKCKHAYASFFHQNGEGH